MYERRDGEILDGLISNRSRDHFRTRYRGRRIYSSYILVATDLVRG